MTNTNLMLAEDHALTLERRANAVRTRLIRALDALDTRRHDIVEVGRKAKRTIVPIASAVAVAAVAAGAAAIAIRRALESKRRLRESSLTARFGRALDGVRPPPQPSFLAEALKRIALAGVTALGAELARRSARKMLDQPAR